MALINAHPDLAGKAATFDIVVGEVKTSAETAIDDEFAKAGEPQFDFVFTVCDSAAAEACPVWPGHPATAHWGIPDPAEAKGTPAEIAVAFEDAYRMLNQRIAVFTALPLRSIDALSLQGKLREIGQMEGSTAKATEAH